MCAMRKRTWGIKRKRTWWFIFRFQIDRERNIVSGREYLWHQCSPMVFSWWYFREKKRVFNDETFHKGKCQHMICGWDGMGMKVGPTI